MGVYNFINMLTPTSPTPDANPELSWLSLPSGSQAKKASYMLPENPWYQRVQYSIEWILQPNENRRWKKWKDQIPDSSFYAILDHAWVRRRANDGSYTPDEQERIIQAARDLASPAEKPSKFSLWLRKQFNATVLALSWWAATPAMAAPTVDLYGRTISQTSQDTNKFLSGMSGLWASTWAMNLPLTAIQINLGEGTTANLWYEYQSLLGSVLSGGLVTQFWEDGAISVNVKVSKDMYNILTQAGYKVTEGMEAKITFSHISEKVNFDFASGSTTTRVPLNTFWATVRFTPKAFAKFVEITGYRISANSISLGQKDYIVETADVIQFFSENRRIAWRSVVWWEVKARFPVSSGSLDVWVWYQENEWNTAISSPKTGGFTGNLQFNAPLSNVGEMRFGLSRGAVSDRVSAGFEHRSGFFMQAYRDIPRDVWTAQTGVQAGIRIALGDRAHSWRSSSTSTSNNKENISSFVSRAGEYVPNSVRYFVRDDSQKTLKVAIAKNGLPKEVEIDKWNASLNINLDNPWTLQSASNTTTWEDVSRAFTMNGNVLTFYPGKIEPTELADWQNSIVVTTSEWYIITIMLQKWSVEVLGVVVTKKLKDAPTTIGNTEVLSVTHNSFELKHHITDADGVRNVVCQEVDVNGNALGDPVKADANGVCTITGKMPDTLYRYQVKAEVLVTSTDTWKSVQTATAIAKTWSLPDVPPVANPDSYSVTVWQGITLNPLANDTTTNGATLTLVSITQPQFGTLQKSSDGTYVYTWTTVGEEKISYIVQTKPWIFATWEITIKIDAKDQPGTIAAPVLSSSTSSSLSLVSGTVTGMTNVEFVLYSDVALTQEVARNSTGIFTGLSSGTTYYARTQALDLNENTGVSEVKKSPYIAVTTNVLDTPDVFTPPTLTIGTNGVTFTGGSVSDPDNTEKGYAPTIMYTVRDSLGNIVSNYATWLSPDASYTYTAKYMTWNRATNALVLKETPPVSFKTDVLPITPNAPSVTTDDMNNTIIWWDASTMQISLDNGATWASTLPDLSGDKTIRVRIKAQGINPPSPETILTFTTNIVAPTVPSNIPTSFNVNSDSGSIDLSAYMQAGWTIEVVSVANPGALNGAGAPNVSVNGSIVNISVPTFYGTYDIPLTLRFTNPVWSSSNFVITAINIGA